MSAALVEAEGLTRRFGDRVAVEDVSLSVSAGEIVALLGPNGAGKTTTLRMIAGLIAPSAGRVTVEGPVGLLTEAPGLWERLSVERNLLTYARLYGLHDPGARVGEALEAVGLTDRRRDPAGQLSKGLKQRAAIARALIPRPRVLLLDEPTAGLDPASARGVRDLVAALRREGRAIVVCTHNLAEAEALADRVGVMRTRLLAIGEARALRGRLAHPRVTIDVGSDAARWIEPLRAAGIPEVVAEGGCLTVHLTDGTGVPEVVRVLVRAGADIERVAPGERTLEEVYLQLVEEEG